MGIMQRDTLGSMDKSSLAATSPTTNKSSSAKAGIASAMTMAAIALFAPKGVEADQATLTLKGTVDTLVGTDNSGVFAPAGTNLAGQPFTLVFSYDFAKGLETKNSTLNMLDTNFSDYLSTTTRPVSAVLTINGKSVSSSGLGVSDIYTNAVTGSPYTIIDVGDTTVQNRFLTDFPGGTLPPDLRAAFSGTLNPSVTCTNYNDYRGLLINLNCSGYTFAPVLPPPPPPPVTTRLPEPMSTEPVVGCGGTTNLTNIASSLNAQKLASEGCTVWNVQPASLSLQLHDRPVGYAPPIGPAINMDVYYSQRDGQQPAAPNYSNMGAKWTNTWTSFVTLNAGDASAKLFERGGGGEVYDLSASTTSKLSPYTQAQLTEVKNSGGAVIGFTRTLKDGSSEQFMQASGSQFFMTAVIDPQGNKATINYDTSNRINTIVDAMGKATTFSYELASDPLKITKITDPFGRFAQFGYTSGQLTSITDTIGITSSFQYTGTFVNTLTTPYGKTKFSFADNTTDSTLGTTRSLTVTDPMNRTSRYEFSDNAPGIAASDSAVPSGMQVTNSSLNTRNTYVWDAQQYALATANGGLDYTKATITHWALTADGSAVSRVPESIKLPLESRMWYNYAGQTDSTKVGSTSLPTAIGRVLDDGSTQLQQFKYNLVGNTTQYTDPVGRVTQSAYYPNGIDLQTVTSTTNGTNVQLFSATYNNQHEPLTVTGANGQTVQYTYTPVGEVDTKTDQQGNRISIIYDNFYPATITKPNGAQIVFTHDNANHIKTVTNEARITVTNDFDNADRLKTQTFMDGTAIQYGYQLLDLHTVTNRKGQTTTIDHNANREVTATTDAMGHKTQYGHAPSGALSSITDANNNTTSFGLDAESRVTSKQYPDGTQWIIAFEQNTSRVHSVTDPLKQVKTTTYNADDTVAAVTYSNSINSTPNVGFTYDPNILRLTGMTDGNGKTALDYYPAGSLGGLQVKGITSPVAGSSTLTDSVGLGYDELGRTLNVTINGDKQSTAFDPSGRTTNVTNVLDAFTYNYADVTARVSGITSTKGPSFAQSYYDATGDGLLKNITATTASKANLAQMGYGYDVNDNVTRFALAYGDQKLPLIASASATNTSTSGSPNGSSAQMFVSSSYTLDGSTMATLGAGLGLAGLLAFGAGGQNRRRFVTASIPLTAAGLLMASCGGGGNSGGATTPPPPPPPPVVTSTLTTYVLDDAQKLTSASVATGGVAPSAPQYVYINDAANNVTGITTPTQNITQMVNAANQITGSGAGYDLNGNITSIDGKTYAWDAENRLIKFTSGSKESTFGYDGMNHLSRVIDKSNGTVTSDKSYTWVGDTLALERDNLQSGSPVTKKFFDQGVIANGTAYYYVKDQLGSVRQMVDVNGAVQAQYDYDPYGQRTQSSGTIKSDIGYGGYLHHEASNLDFTLRRAYDPTRARWLNRDPIGEAGGTNLYAYVGGNPVSKVDPRGLYDEAPQPPDPKEPVEGMKKIKDAVKIFALGSAIDTSVAGIPIGICVQSGAVAYGATGLAQIGKYGYDLYKLNEYLQTQEGPFGAENTQTPFGANNPDTPFGKANRRPVTTICSKPQCTLP